MGGSLFMIKATAKTLPPGEFFLRHFNNEGELTTFDNTRSADFKFMLNESGSFVRFQSLEFPKKFLRHKAFRLLLEEPAPNEGRLFLDDSTFIALPPNNGVGSILTQAFSFGASDTQKFPNHFIRHRDFHVFLNKVTPDDEQAKQDSSFQLVPTT
jgi:Alpha-L-arabinofuranosidase B (ABFB) domain